MTFANAVRKEVSEKCHGWNGAVEYTSKGVENIIVAFFYKLVRGLTSQEIFNYVEMISNERNTKLNADMVVLAFQTRATRNIGKGERKLFYDMIMALQKYLGEDVVLEILCFIPEYGYYKDYLYLMNHPECSNNVYNECINILCKQISQDSKLCENGKHKEISLLGKYMPREKGAFTEIAFKIADKMFDGNKHSKMRKYRKMLSKINKDGIQTVTEVFMCDNNFSSIDFTKVSSICLKRNRKAFLNLKHGGIQQRHNTQDRIEARNNLLNTLNTQKVHGGELFPYDIVKSLIHKSVSQEEIEVLESQWSDMRSKLLDIMNENNLRTDNMIVMSDVSGSMFMNNYTPLAVSISLGILFSEISTSMYKNLVLTFDTDPRFVILDECKNIYEKVRKLAKAPWGFTTDILKAMKLVLNVAEKYNVETIPNILIVSDMQFDSACGLSSETTHYEYIKQEFENSGKRLGRQWNIPKIIFWNVSERTQGFPVKASQENTYLMSGFSPSLFKYIFSENIGNQSENLFEKVITDPAFDKIRLALSNMTSGTFSNYNFTTSIS